MVIHDDIKDKERKLKAIPDRGYQLLHHFQLPDDAWGVHYYKPLSNKIKQIIIKYKNSSKVVDALKKYQDEVNAFQKNPSAFKSIFYIMKKI